MTNPFSAKPLRVSIATALALGSLATTPAFAQLTTSGSYVPSNADVAGVAITSAPGNTETLAQFQTKIAAAYAANSGGDANFDNLNATVGDPANGNFGNSYSQTLGTPISATYGTNGSKTITFTDGVAINPNNSGVGVVGAPYSFNNNDPQTAAGGATTSGVVYLGTSGGTTPVLFQFSQNLTDFGIIVLNRNAARAIDMIVTLSNGTTVTPDTAVATSTPTTGPVFFQYQPASGLSITSVSFNSPGGFARFDDLGFIVAAPEPSQVAGLGLGVLGIGLLALKARKRTVLGS